MSGAMSGARPQEIGRTFFTTRRWTEVLDLADVRLYSSRRHPEAFPSKEALMDHLMSLDELQHMLGVSRSTARRWTKRHKVKPVYVLGCVRFWHSEVLAVLEVTRGVLR